MKDKFWIRRLFSRKDNQLSLITVLIAGVVAILGLFVDSVETDHLLAAIIVLLGLTAIGQILERETRFEKIDESLDQLLGNRHQSLKKEDEVPDLVPFMERGREIFFTGGHLHSTVQSCKNVFKSWLEDDKSIKILLQDPDNDGLLKLKMPCAGYDGVKYSEDIRDSIRMLKDLKDSTSGDLQVFVTDVTPTQSVTILDPEKDTAKMRVLFHLPEGEGKTAPYVLLDRESDAHWFDLFHSRYYEELWENAKPVIGGKET